MRVRKGSVGPRTPSPTDVARVCELLEHRYGSPRHGNPADPLDDLFFIILSNRTSFRIARRVFEEVKDRFGAWDELLGLPESQLRALIAPAGLSVKRATQMRGIISRVTADFGSATLWPLSRWTDDAAEAYLVSLPGVSDKVAKCVLMYTLGREVLPVDVHVHRITRRLGWHHHGRADQSHETLEKLVPPKLRYSFHVNCVAHGRLVCQPGLPICSSCVVQEFCHYYLAGSPAKEIPSLRESGSAMRVAERPAGSDRQQ